MPSPWSIKGIPPEARAAAKEAAHRQGMTLGAWLVSKIQEEADTTGDEGGAQARPAPMRRPSIAPPLQDAAAMQAMAQILGQQMGAPMGGAGETAAVAALSARIDALSEVVSGLANTVSQSMKTVEECAEAARGAESIAKTAAENAEMARNEAATSLRASAAVAEKTVAALGGVDAPLEDLRADLEAMIEDRIGRIEERIAEAEEDGSSQLDELSASMARTEAALARLTTTGATVSLSDAAPAQPTPEMPEEASSPSAETQPMQDADADFAAAFGGGEDGDLREIPGRHNDGPVEQLHAPQLRELIRSRGRSEEAAGHAPVEEKPAASLQSWDAAEEPQRDTVPAPAPESWEAEPSQDEEETSKSGGFGLSSWFRRRPAASESPVASYHDTDDQRIGYEEVFPEDTPHQSAVSSDDASQEEPSDAPAPQLADWGAQPAPSFENPYAEQAPEAAPARAPQGVHSEQDREEPSVDAHNATFSDPFDAPYGDQDAFEDDYDEEEGFDQEHFSGAYNDQTGGFDAAIERARRERERFRAQEQVEAERLAVNPLAHSARRFSASPPSAREDREVPLTLDSDHALPPEDDAPQPSHWLAATGDDDLEELDGAPRPAATQRDRSEPQTESIGAKRSVISAEAWPFEQEFDLEQTREKAMRDESGSVRYGVALSLAFMALTAGAAMAALYKLGA